MKIGGRFGVGLRLGILTAGCLAWFCAPTGPERAMALVQVSKVYVFPYQPATSGVSKEVLTQITDLLKNEIKHSQEMQLQKGPIFIPEVTETPMKPLSDKELRRAKRAFEKGLKYYQAFNFDKAARAFESALKRYSKSIALLQDMQPVLDTLLMLSVCYYRTEKEDLGRKMLEKVIRLKPDLQLDPSRYPPVFRNTAERIRKRLLLKRRGELEVIANVDGATVYFNGQKVGTTPLVMKDLLPGEHYLRVEKEGLQAWAQEVKVVSTQKRRILASLGGVKKLSGPLGSIAQSLRENRIDKATIGLARKEGRKIGADYVIMGGIGLVGGMLKVGSVLVSVQKGTVCPLPGLELDKDLLGASVEVYNMASKIPKLLEGCPEPAKKLPLALIESKVAAKKLKTVRVGPVAPPPEEPASKGAPAVAAGRGVAIPPVAKP
ncbi:MAG: PEGA domain-containing protein, partial [Deltaproteobacteria bacterium]